MRVLLTLFLITTSLTISGQTFDTELIYSDSSGKNVIIQNSFPKGGINYTAPSGEKFVYAIFWTRITNEKDSPIDLKIDYSSDPFNLPYSLDNSVKLLLPPSNMTLEKEPLFNYGLTDLETYLNINFNKKSSLNKTINPKESFLFYVTALYNKGVEGNIRAGFILKDNKLFYRISGLEIACGEIEPI
ncbi:hypothetical protein [Gramella sp. KN1008]|uniref:hypothetical protein n=1 Tax=Gramella sp. KN1008 TaxID=2529298 RepID=UPI0010387EE3|nr:hypothetical protein [Gramella sp. KN1008]TBW28701.1 hypothetical protein EZJ28_08185 [Gramella sp. KN1008]